MEHPKKRSFTIHELSGRFAVVRLDAGSEVPIWARTGSLNAVLRTSDELSIVCDQSMVPAGVKSDHDWAALKIEGPLPLTTTGVLASILTPLASASIAVFAISTFDTDYILVKADDIQHAKEVLAAKGHRFG